MTELLDEIGRLPALRLSRSCTPWKTGASSVTRARNGRRSAEPGASLSPATPRSPRCPSAERSPRGATAASGGADRRRGTTRATGRPCTPRHRRLRRRRARQTPRALREAPPTTVAGEATSPPRPRAIRRGLLRPLRALRSTATRAVDNRGRCRSASRRGECGTPGLGATGAGCAGRLTTGDGGGPGWKREARMVGATREVLRHPRRPVHGRRLRNLPDECRVRLAPPPRRARHPERDARGRPAGEPVPGQGPQARPQGTA